MTPYQPQHWMYYITSTPKERVCAQGFVAAECDHKTTPNLIKGACITAGGGLACNTCKCFLFRYGGLFLLRESRDKSKGEEIQAPLVKSWCVMCAGSSYCPYHRFPSGVDFSKLHTGYACRACTDSDRLLTLTSNLQNALPISSLGTPARTPNYAIKTMRSIMSCSILGTNPCMHVSFCMLVK